MYELLLVSQSPRRQDILTSAGFLFRVDTVKLSEIIEENVNLGPAVANLALAKGVAYMESHKHLKSQDILVLSADTVVYLAPHILGKPQNSTEAEHFLRELSGKTHSVITGLAIQNLKTGELVTDFCETKVEFRELSNNEISAYVASGEPMDKAGAYAIQGEGRKFVNKFVGSLTNVIGLPLELLEKTLSEKGWSVARRRAHS